ncbi:hypothetical protein FNF27_03039 [Cafeteria roenbergensis]|uniref:Uncharacterized protein n=1 Tax=Cafeteria roenbergensis TaxID=33653 RepID=A0A5A8EBV8_CAFRO|nr:hypothetical protein FNF27_03039 [Cafeteria roenbergensis]
MGCGASTAAKSGERAEPINAGAPGPRARDAASSASQEQPGRAAAASDPAKPAATDPRHPQHGSGNAGPAPGTGPAPPVERAAAEQATGASSTLKTPDRGEGGVPPLGAPHANASGQAPVEAPALASGGGDAPSHGSALGPDAQEGRSGEAAASTTLGRTASERSEHNSDAASVDIAGAELGAQPEPAEQPGALGAEGKGDLADDASPQSYIEARDSFRELETAALSTKQETLQQQRDLAERRSARQGSHWNAELEQRTQATAAARQFREGMPSRGAAKMSWSETMSRAVIDRSDTLPDAKKKFTQLDSQASHTTGTLHRAHTLPGLAMTQAARQARPPPPGPSPGGAALSPPLPGGTTAAGSTGAGSTGAGSTGAGSFPEGGSTPAAADPGPGDAEGERPKPAPASEGSPARDGAGLA